MRIVYLIDGITRLILPDARWSDLVLGSLIARGSLIEITNDNPEVDLRPMAEKLRALAILNSVTI